MTWKELKEISEGMEGGREWQVPVPQNGQNIEDKWISSPCQTISNLIEYIKGDCLEIRLKPLIALVPWTLERGNPAERKLLNEENIMVFTRS